MRCKLCGSENAAVLNRIKSKYRSKGNIVRSEFSIIRCSNCSLIRVEPFLKQDILLEKYDKDYFKQYLNNTDDRKIYFREILDELDNLTDKGSILDIGCGDGLFLYLARSEGWRVYGVEPSSVAANFVKESYGIDVFNGIIEESNFKKGDFSLITLLNVLEHMLDPVSCIGAIRDLLRKDGLLVIETPNFENIWFKYRALENTLLGLDNLHMPGHTHWFTMNTLHSLLTKMGFDVLESKYINYNILSPGKLWPHMAFYKKLFMYYRNTIEINCNLISRLFKTGNHIRVICKAH